MKHEFSVVKEKLDNLIIADHIVLGFNAYFLLEVYKEALGKHFKPKEARELVDLIEVHHCQGTAVNTISFDQMMKPKVKDNFLANEILLYRQLYEACLVYLVTEFDVDVEGVLQFFNQIIDEPDNNLDSLDYIQAHRWFASAIDYYSGRCTKVKCYAGFERFNTESEVEEVLSFQEVDGFAKTIYEDFQQIVKERKDLKKQSLKTEV